MSQEPPYVTLPTGLYDRLQARARHLGITVTNLTEHVLDPLRAPYMPMAPRPGRPEKCTYCRKYLPEGEAVHTNCLEKALRAAVNMVANPFIRCDCCPGGCRRWFLWRNTYRCGCPAAVPGPPA